MCTTVDDLLAYCRESVIAAGGPRAHFDTKASWLRRAADQLGIPPARAFSFYYRRARNVGGPEILAIKAKMDSLEQRLAQEKARHEEIAEALARAREAAGLARSAFDRGLAAGMGDGSIHHGEAGSAGDAADRAGPKAVQRLSE